MKIEQFYLGQRVKQYDEDERCNVYGHVTKVFDESVYIRWNDLNEDTRYDDPKVLESIKDSLER